MRFTFDEICESQDFERDAEFVRYEFYYELERNNTDLNAKIKERDELIKTGLSYMQEAHNKFTPNVTNSLALDWIEQAKQLTEEK